MTIDFPSSYPAIPAVSAGKPVDVQTLQEAFAAALRNYGTEKGGTTSTMLEVLRPTPHADNAPNENRNQQRREQQHTDRKDVTNIDRKLLEKSEIRSSGINSDYRDRIDRNETLRNDYQGRIERNELQQSAVQVGESSPAVPTITPVDAARQNESVPYREHPQPQQRNVPVMVNTNNQHPLVNVPDSTANTGLVNVLLPSGNVSVSLPTMPAPQVVPPQTVTLFTPMGRFGQTHGKTDDKNDKEDEEEEQVEGAEPEKQQPFAEFEAIRSRQDVSRQTKRPELTQVAEKPRERPKETEPEQVRSAKALAELLNTPPQNVAISKKGDMSHPNQTQYLNRIAAACEAASHFAPIRIKLNLDHLGTLTLRFYYKADKLTLRFETPSKESARFVHDHLRGLRTILSKRDMKIADIEILETADEEKLNVF